MLSMNELKPGTLIELENEPYQVLESRHSKIAKGRPVMQTKVRNLITGKVRPETFQQSDKLPEAEVERLQAKFAYRTKSEFFFVVEPNGGEDESTTNKISFTEDILGEKTGYLKKDTPVEIYTFREKPISIELPLKVTLEVKDAPPAIKGDTVQGALKEVTLETGATVKTPLFVEAGEKIEVDTRTGAYIRRVN